MALDSSSFPLLAEQLEAACCAEGVVHSIEGLTHVSHSRFLRHRHLLQQPGDTPQLAGSFVWAELTSEPVKAGSACVTRITICNIELAADDSRGLGEPVNGMLGVLNAMTSYTSSAAEVLPKGALVAVKEPHWGTSSSGDPVLLVPCPASIEFFLDPPANRLTIGEDEAKVLRLQANNFFGQGKIILAGQLYTRCINRLRSVPSQEYALASRNRAECFMRLQRYEDVILDCNRALEVNETDVKSLFRKGVALLELQEHQQALACFDAAVSHSSGVGKSRVQQEMTRCKNLIRQAECGSYNISQFLLSGFEEIAAPELSDYVGPVEIKLTGDGRGRGVFVTQDVPLGTLLMVSNPTVLVLNPRQRTSEEQLNVDFFVETLKMLSNSYRAFQQFQALSHEKTVPDMALFKSSAGQAFWHTLSCEKPALDLDRVKKVLQKASFGVKYPGVAHGIKYAPKYKGVWALPGFINHSCVPNASKLDVGRAILVRAARDLKAGDEVAISYIECLSSHTYRRERCFECWQFYCQCERCMVDNKHFNIFKEVKQPNWHENTVACDTELAMTCPQICAQVEKALANLSTITELDKNWIRSSFSQAYCFCASEYNRKFLQGMDDHEFLSAGQVIKMLHETAPGHFTTTMYTARMSSRMGMKSKTDVEKAMELVKAQLEGTFGDQPLHVWVRLLELLHQDKIPLQIIGIET